MKVGVVEDVVVDEDVVPEECELFQNVGSRYGEEQEGRAYLVFHIFEETSD